MSVQVKHQYQCYKRMLTILIHINHLNVLTYNTHCSQFISLLELLIISSKMFAFLNYQDAPPYRPYPSNYDVSKYYLHYSNNESSGIKLRRHAGIH